jgi:hypothetical protein
LPKPRAFPAALARSLEAIGESPRALAETIESLAAAMRPRDAWEAAWVEDIAVLRWRRERLQRAEAAVVALRKRRLDYERCRAALPRGGVAGLEFTAMLGAVGLVGAPDSAVRFQKILKCLRELLSFVRAELFDDTESYFTVLYGKNPGFDGALLKTRFITLAKMYKDGQGASTQEIRETLLAELHDQIDKYEKLQALYVAEHVEADAVQHEAELLLPAEEMAQIIQYETHLEDQIERKLRQFYARRREAEIDAAESFPEVAEGAAQRETTVLAKAPIATDPRAYPAGIARDAAAQSAQI